jgi:hypothetical protein
MAALLALLSPTHGLVLYRTRARARISHADVARTDALGLNTLQAQAQLRGTDRQQNRKQAFVWISHPCAGRLEVVLQAIAIPRCSPSSTPTQIKKGDSDPEVADDVGKAGRALDSHNAPQRGDYSLGSEHRQLSCGNLA